MRKLIEFSGEKTCKNKIFYILAMSKLKRNLSSSELGVMTTPITRG